MTRPPRIWDGKTVHLTESPGPGRNLQLGITEDAARKLAIALARNKQTYFTIEPEVEEILNALNYVLVADPASVAAHRVIEAGKGMTPDGGYKAPNGTVRHRFLPSVLSPGACRSWSSGFNVDPCGRTLEEHDPRFQDKAPS